MIRPPIVTMKATSARCRVRKALHSGAAFGSALVLASEQKRSRIKHHFAQSSVHLHTQDPGIIRAHLNKQGFLSLSGLEPRAGPSPSLWTTQRAMKGALNQAAWDTFVTHTHI